MSKILILGLGNDILSDDAIGPKLVYRLEEEIKKPGLEFQTSALGGLEIVEIIRDFEKVIIIDAIKTTDGEAGTVYHFTPEDFTETLHASNFHDVSFLTALKLAEKMEITTPSSVDIFAIEILEDLEFSDEFSPLIQSKYDAIYEEVKQYILNLLMNN